MGDAFKTFAEDMDGSLIRQLLVLCMQGAIINKILPRDQQPSRDGPQHGFPESFDKVLDKVLDKRAR